MARLADAWRTFLRYRGKRVVSCPETHAPAAVEVAAAWAAITTPFDRCLRLKSCSRWPDRQACDQPCLMQIQVAPRDTLISTILRRWYEGQSCAVCGRPLDKHKWLQHNPAALGPESTSVEWRDVAPEKIPGMLATHLPICWNCHTIETFRRAYPELIVERPWKTQRRR